MVIKNLCIFLLNLLILIIKCLGDVIMFSKSYYDNINGKNILTDYRPKDMSNDYLDNFTDSYLENMVINSNLDNSNMIK